MSVKPIEETETGRVERPATVKVWDPFVRVFHWSLVVLFALAWATEDLQAVHQPIGYAILLLILMRIAWGFVGSTHARFADFLRPPRATLTHARGLIAGSAPRLLGHNPVGGVMVLALLTMLVATGVSGWLITAEGFRDAEWLEELHEALASLTLVLVVVHVLAVLAMSVLHGENLVKAMITGRKHVCVGRHRREARKGSPGQRR